MSTPLVTIHRAAATVAAYESAVSLGVLDRVDREPARPDEIAAGCGISQRGADLLLHALASLGILSRDEQGRYRPTVDHLASLHTSLDPWRHLAEVVSYGGPTTEHRDYSGVVSHLEGVASGAAQRVAQLLPPARRILDVGAGAAPWSLALAARDHRSTVTALDHASVLVVTEQAVHSAGLEAQFDYLPGDLFTADLTPLCYDLVVLGHLCHLFSSDVNRALLVRLTRTLRPDGTLAIIDVPPGTTPAHAIYELSLFVRTKAGRLHALGDYRAWLGAAGLEAAAPLTLGGEIPLALITGRANPEHGEGLP